MYHVSAQGVDECMIKCTLLLLNNSFTGKIGEISQRLTRWNDCGFSRARRNVPLGIELEYKYPWRTYRHSA